MRAGALWVAVDAINGALKPSTRHYLCYFRDGQSGIAELRKKFVQAREAA